MFEVSVITHDSLRQSSRSPCLCAFLTLGVLSSAFHSPLPLPCLTSLSIISIPSLRVSRGDRQSQVYVLCGQQPEPEFLFRQELSPVNCVSGRCVARKKKSCGWVPRTQKLKSQPVSAENPELPEVLTLNRGEGQTVALHACLLPDVRTAHNGLLQERLEENL